MSIYFNKRIAKLSVKFVYFLDFKFFSFFYQKPIDKFKVLVYNIYRSREWRNRQTRTFEGRVSLMYGFKSRFPHQIKTKFVLGLYFFNCE